MTESFELGGKVVILKLAPRDPRGCSTIDIRHEDLGGWSELLSVPALDESRLPSLQGTHQPNIEELRRPAQLHITYAPLFKALFAISEDERRTMCSRIRATPPDDTWMWIGILTWLDAEGLLGLGKVLH